MLSEDMLAELNPSNEAWMVGVAYFVMFLVGDLMGDVTRVLAEQVYYCTVTFGALYDWLYSPLVGWTPAQILILRASIPYFIYYSYLDAKRNRWPFVVHHLIVLAFFLFPAKCPEYHYVFVVAGLMEISNITLNTLDLIQLSGCQPDSLIYKVFGVVFVISFVFRLLYPLPAILFLCLGFFSAGSGCKHEPGWWYVVTACIVALIALHVKWTAHICGRFMATFFSKNDGPAKPLIGRTQKKSKRY